jgi:hypothetical protein
MVALVCFNLLRGSSSGFSFAALALLTLVGAGGGLLLVRIADRRRSRPAATAGPVRRAPRT